MAFIRSRNMRWDFFLVVKNGAAIAPFIFCVEPDFLLDEGLIINKNDLRKLLGLKQTVDDNR